MSPTPQPTQEELQRQIAALQAQLAALHAQPQRTSASATAADGATALAIAGSVFGPVTVHSGVGPSPRQLLAHYLEKLIADCQKLKLDVIDEKNTADPSAQLRLSAIYTALQVNAADYPPDAASTLDPKADPEQALHGGRQPLSAVAFASRHPRAVILGRPGAGKTTFTDFLCLCLAGELTRSAEVNLSLLGADWQAGTPLPLRVILREYTALSLHHGLSIWQHLTAGWKDSLAGFADPARRHLMEQGGLLVLDGLDEVPEASQCREKVKTAVLDFQKDFPRVRLLVTSRTYAYTSQKWRLPGFESAELAPFGPDQWNAFIDKWYAELAGIRRNFTTGSAQHRAAELRQVIADRPHLQELAASPLLLTLMASLHALRGGALPRERERLYEDSVSLLLDFWERPKVIHQDGQPVVITASAQEFLRLSSRADLEKAIARLAYEVHSSQGHKSGVADIPEGDLLAALSRVSPGINPALLADYVRDRAGLLTNDGVGIYRFPHRTFQEYMAARHLGDLGPDQIARHLREDPGRWREAFLLAGAKTARGGEWAAWTLVQHVCPAAPKKGATTAAWLCASIAGQLLAEIDLATGDTAVHDQIRATVVQALVRLVSGGHLDPRERARAGAALGLLGDPRPGVATLEPDWVEIPAGPFLYGDAKENRRIDHPFHISRYPVTVAQYQAFVGAGGYSADAELREAGITEPESYEPIYQTPNHPRVGVSHLEAEAFCRWLFTRLGRSVRLPTELEWERAARGPGGLELPWGSGSPPEKHANITMTLGHTSPVGMYPTGAAPEGCLDMAGNVWEWTSSPYESGSSARVLRGGAFFDGAVLARCAYRDRYRPRNRDAGIGFRVVASPF